MGIPRTYISLSVVLSACATGARAIHVGGPPRNQRQNLSWESDGERDMCVSFEMTTEQTVDIEPGALVYGSGCSKQRLRSGGIYVDQWYGRIGNNVYQIAHAIFAAKLYRRTKVYTPPEWTPQDGSIRQLFNFSDLFTIEKDDEFRRRVNCQDSTTSGKAGHYFLYKCFGVRRSDYTNVLRTYLLPHLTHEGRAACKKEEENTKRELVVHLRAGDLLDPSSADATSKKGRMAPCSFVDGILADPRVGSFEGIRVVTEPDRKHPCLNHYASAGATVQSESLAADACSFMHAEHLAFGSKSTFSEALSLFNPKAVTLYEPMACVTLVGRKSLKEECPPDHGHACKYCVKEMDQARSVENKVNWVLNFPSSSISPEGMQCFE